MTLLVEIPSCVTEAVSVSTIAASGFDSLPGQCNSYPASVTLYLESHLSPEESGIQEKWAKGNTHK